MPGASQRAVAHSGCHEFYDDRSSALFHQRCIANELKRVPKTLLGVKKDRSSYECLAGPPRLGDWPL